jgi:diphosphate-dependent phosphofructokinase
MAEHAHFNLDALMRHPEAKNVVASQTTALKERLDFKPNVCAVFKHPFTRLENDNGYIFRTHRAVIEKLPDISKNLVQKITGLDDADTASRQSCHSKRRIGIVFSGGPAPGGHNVIAGLYDAMVAANPDNRLYGFILGPDGILENDYREITRELVDAHRNIGSFSMIKTGRTKIDSREKMDNARETCKTLNLDALVIVGGDDSNTNAAFLAQDFFKDGIQVIGVPKTIDGDIQVRDQNGAILCAVSFGFHSAARAFSRDISNLCSDGSSDVKYWHVCKVMGRVASHLGLEVALQVHPNIILIGEEMADFVDTARIEKARKEGTTDYTAYGMTLRHVSRSICDGIVRRAAVGKNYGVIVIPEGVLEFINEIQIFIIKLNTIIAEYNQTHDTDFHSTFVTLDEKLDYLRRLARQSREDKFFTTWNTRDDDLFNDIPAFFQEGLLTERDSHGNFQFSQMETEKVLMGLVSDYLKILKERGEYKIGIRPEWYRKTMEKGGLDPDLFGPILFKNYTAGDACLLVRNNIVSVKTLTQELQREGVLAKNRDIPSAILRVYQTSVPKFKTQHHFYGYDGRGSDPTWFDCTYTYNLGLTVFSLIAGKATGQMAAIKNLEKDFSEWEPIGIPIAPLMHLEERKGRLELVLERAIVDLDSPAYRVVKSLQEKWLAAGTEPDEYRNPGPIRFQGRDNDVRPLTLILNNLGRASSTES